MFAPVWMFAQLDSLTVKQAIEKALENNYQIKMVQANVQVSELQNTWANAGMIPTFSLGLTNSANLADNSNNPASFFPSVVFNDNLSASVDMNWTVFNGFGIRINKQKYEQLQAQTEGNAMVTIETMIYDVIIAYYSAVVQERQLDLLKEMMDYSRDKVEYYQLKSEVGVGTSMDLLEFENQWLSDSSNYILQQYNFKNAKRNLNLLMAEGPEFDYVLSEALAFDVPNMTYGEMESAMMSDNRNLNNQYISLQLQELNTEAQKSSYYPTVSLNLGASPSVGYIAMTDGSYETTTNAISYYGTINVNYTIFNGWQRKRNLEIAKIQYQITDYETQDLILSLKNQLKSVFELYKTQAMVEGMSIERVKRTQQLWQLGQERYQLGLINVFNLNDIKLTYMNAVITYYDQLFSLLQTHYDLLKLTGQISQPFNIE